MKTKEELLNTIKNSNIKFIDFRFTDLKGKIHQISYLVSTIEDDLLDFGLMFDGSSIKGWKDISNSDMLIRPDFSTCFIDPFALHPTIVITCDILDPFTQEGYEHDPRLIAKKAESYVKESKIGDTALFGPELEFFVFDGICFQNSNNESYSNISTKSDVIKTNGSFSNNIAHISRPKEAYFNSPPLDDMYEIRAEMLLKLQEVGITPTMHHHEVAPNQCELGIEYSTLLNTADNVQKYKYIIQKVAQKHNKTATFMPKPIKGDNGSGMHVHQSIWKGNKPVFGGDEYANLSKEALYYIGGIIKHAKAINAFSNPTTNSYKRLIPGYEAPTLLAYSSCNRSAAIRIPFSNNLKAKRLELRFPDPTANPYLTFAAMLMAGLDGIQNKIHPGDAQDHNLYNSDINNIPKVSTSLRESLDALDRNRSFLTKNNVFNNNLIDAYIKIKLEEIDEIENTPHPMEYSLYYSS